MDIFLIFLSLLALITAFITLFVAETKAIKLEAEYIEKNSKAIEILSEIEYIRAEFLKDIPEGDIIDRLSWEHRISVLEEELKGLYDKR